MAWANMEKEREEDGHLNLNKRKESETRNGEVTGEERNAREEQNFD